MDNQKELKYSKILIINLGGVGDFILSIPALKALKNAHKDSCLAVLTTEVVAEAAKDLNIFNEVYCFALEFGGIIPQTKIIDDIKIIWKLHNEHFDMAINMRTLVSKKSANKIKLLLKAINPRVSVGRDTEGRGGFFDVKVPEPHIGEKHESEYDIDTVKALGIEVSEKKIELNIGSETKQKIDEFLKQNQISEDDTIIGIHPGGMPSRRWPIHNFIKLIETVSSEAGCVFVLTGGRNEKELIAKIVDQTDARVVSAAGALSFKELIALTNRCSVFISNDTGPMHIAAALKIPLIAIFGPGDITRFNPKHISENSVVFYNRVECAPCEKPVCDDLKCLKSIMPEKVADSVFELLSKSK